MSDRPTAPSDRLRVQIGGEEAEVALRVAQRMEAIGRLAGGIAHDFNNMLSLILSYAELMDETLELSHPARPDLEEIRKAATRGARLTRELLMFSRTGTRGAAVTEVNAVLKDFESLLRRAGGRAELVLDLGPEVSPAHIRPGQLEQIVMNLVLNARDAMPIGGRVVVSTRNVNVTMSSPQRDRGIPPDRYVQLSVEDEGTGIHPDIAKQMFEPFFSTKPLEMATGLGLPTVQGIVTSVGGYISLDSKLDQGARFDVLLRCCDPSAQDPPD